MWMFCTWVNKKEKREKMIQRNVLLPADARVRLLVFIIMFLMIGNKMCVASYATIYEEIKAIDSKLTIVETAAQNDISKITDMNYITADGCVVKAYTKDNVTVGAKDYEAIEIEMDAKVGYRFIGTMGYDIGSASSSGTNNWNCHACSAFANEGDASASVIVRNRSTTDAKIKVTIYVLYVKK